ncbi:MAG: hypothetical protein ACI9E1_001128 [Cryomorphaceae bacterium]
MKNYSSIKLTHKGIHIVEILNFNTSTTVTPSNKNLDYKAVTVIEDKENNVLEMGPNGWLENIILNGKDSALMDDLKYTKQAAHLGKFKKYIDGFLPKKEKKLDAVTI